MTVGSCARAIGDEIERNFYCSYNLTQTLLGIQTSLIGLRMQMCTGYSAFLPTIASCEMHNHETVRSCFFFFGRGQRVEWREDGGIGGSPLML